MTKPPKTSYKLLPEWTIRQDENVLTISGGADAGFEIELESPQPSFFSTLKSSVLFSRDKLNEVDQRVLEELVTAEIVVPRLRKLKNLRVAVIGDSNKLSPPGGASIKLVENSQAYDLALIIRTNSTYSNLLSDINYRNILKPHLFIDVAFHHTLSIGPLVFPGETACIACLQGRVTTRWGDGKPPTKPLVISQYPGVVAELIGVELARIANDDTSLTNKTVSWNFQDRTIRKDQLLKVPICPVCTQNRIDPGGSLALPWDKT